MKWTWFNLSYPVLRWFGTPVMRVRYETLVRQPREVLEQAAAFLGVPIEADTLAFLHEAARSTCPPATSRPATGCGCSRGP